ncbi:MAG: hypothetical protein KDD51_04770 [Bdellovibrionales bacterium]|nr:hypothetical protein [Bdellovibrionales bacterium]
MSNFNNIYAFWHRRLAVYTLFVCLIPLHLWAEAPHTDDLGLPSSRLEAEKGPVAGRCGVDPRRLASFANGENYDYANLVSFLSTPSCLRVAATVSQAAVQSGVTFSNKAPFRFDLYSEATRQNDLKGRDKADVTLQTRIPTLLRQYPLGSNELLPIIGQLALLSPGASRSALVNFSQQQLYTADSLLNVRSSDADGMAGRVAKTLVKLGVNRGPIASEFAASVEEMALLAQADSLGKIFRALGAAAVANNALVSTFNLSAGALNKGIARGVASYDPQAKDSMLLAVYSAVLAANEGNELFQPAMAELNEAMDPLLDGYPVRATRLRNMWDEILKMLSENASQSVMADAVAISLTPEILFLSEEDRVSLLMAARNYHPMAVAIQQNFLLAFNRLWKNYQSRKLTKERFSELRQKFMKPWVSHILELGPARLTRSWLNEVIQLGLIENEDIEKKFPLFVLANLQRSDRANLSAVSSDTVEPKLASMAENMAVMWSLSAIHVPVLMKWVENYDK